MPDIKIKKSVRPFVKEGAPLNFSRDLKNKGLWPPRLHDKRDNNNNDGQNPTATPYLVVPADSTDTGLRPLPNSKAFYSSGVWLEDLAGNPVAQPVTGGSYKIKCKVTNLGPSASYGGMVIFFLAKPVDINAAAGTTNSLTVFGINGFTVLPGLSVTVPCLTNWLPITTNDLMNSIVVHAFDPMAADNVISRFDARNDRHVGRHDFTADFYVRDWTADPLTHDNGQEPSSNGVFYTTSDIWNRRSNSPGAFINDQPGNENPQAGNGSAGENFVFARISRSNTSNEETVSAHFLLAEFGTGSPYVNCSADPDPSVTFLAGEDQKLVSLPWQLHPSSSTHLCLGVQVYSDGDSYMPPGLLGYTPGWPTTDLMVINDNNKAQRNMHVWDGVPEQSAVHYAVIKNSAVFARDFSLQVIAAKSSLRRLTNPRIVLPGSGSAEAFDSGYQVTLKNMQPGEARWIGVEYDGFIKSDEEMIQISFNEIVGREVVNGFAIGINAVSGKEAVLAALLLQRSIFFRMSEGMGIDGAKEALAFTEEILAGQPGEKAYLGTIKRSAAFLTACSEQMSKIFGGLKDVFDVNSSLQKLAEFNTDNDVSAVTALHLKLLNQLDAWQTTAIKSRGDEADILFTFRLQKEVYGLEKLAATGQFTKLVYLTDKFIAGYPLNRTSNAAYPDFVKGKLMEDFRSTLQLVPAGILSEDLDNLAKAIESGNVAGTQKMHLAFLNDLLSVLTR